MLHALLADMKPRPTVQRLASKVNTKLAVCQAERMGNNVLVAAAECVPGRRPRLGIGGRHGMRHAPQAMSPESCIPESGGWADVSLRLQDVFQVGERVRVLVAGMEDDMRRISFSTALLEVNPGDMLHNKVRPTKALCSKCLSWRGVCKCCTHP